MKNKTNLRIFKLAEMSLCAAMAILTLLIGQATAQAQGIISLRFDVGGYTGSAHNYNFMFPADIAGAPGVRTNNWNNIPAPYNGSSPQVIGTNGIYDASGTTIPNMGCVASFGGSGSDGWFDRVAPTISTNDGKMFADVADVYGNNAIASFGYLQVTNIPYTNYNLYCYFRDDNGSGSGNSRGGVWIITNTPSGTNRIYICNQTNDGSYTQINLPNNSGVGYQQSTTAAIASGGVAWTSIQGGNFVEFTGLTNANLMVFFNGLGNGSGPKDDLGNYVNGGSTAVRFKVCGFQIQQVNLGAVTSIYFSPSNEFVHVGNPIGTQTYLYGNTLAGPVLIAPSVPIYTSDNTNVAAVTMSGLIQPGTNGIAHIIAAYQGFYATNTVTNIGPTSLSISVAQTNLLSGNGQGDSTTATLLANFPDANNVTVNSYQFVSFSASPAGIITITSNGIITAVAPGTYSVTGTYDQMSVTANGVGIVNAYSAPGSVPSFAVKVTDNNTAHFMSFHDLSGATAVRFAYWNNMVLSLGNVTNNYSPFDYQGNSLSNTVIQIMPGPTLNQDAFTTAGTLTTNESKLFDTYWDEGMNSGTTVSSTMVISNVPYSAYDIYFYVYNDNTSNGTNRPGVFVIDGVDQWRLNNPSANTQPDNTGNGYVQAAPQPSGIPGSVVDVPYGNFVKFSGVTDSVLTVQWAAVGQDYIGDAASVTRLRLVGFQVVSSFDGLTPTNIFLGTPVPSLLPGNPTVFTLSVLANYAIGVKNVPITDYPGITFTSANTNIFSVDTNGNITAGLVPGTTNLVVAYDGLSLTQAVTVLSPIFVTVGAMPNTVYIDSSLGQPQPAQADLFGTFPGNTNINVSAFNSVSFVDQGSPVATLSANGTITVNNAGLQGSVNLGASYLGNTYVTPNAFKVSSITNPPSLKHLYNFTNYNAVIDTIGGANGTIYGPLSTNQPITFDGQHIIFPGDGVYSDEPYVSLPQYLLANNMGDVTIELWGGVTARNTWERFLGFGNTPKGLTPYAYGGTASSNAVQLIAVAPPGADFNLYGLGDYVGTPSILTNNGEYYIVAEVAPNAGISAVYINGVLVTNVTLASGEYLSAVDDTVDWLGVSLSNDDPPLAGWMNKLAIWEGVMTASQVESNYIAGVNVYYPPGYSALPTNPPPIGFSYSGGNLNLSWPPNYLGYTLQAQTNTVKTGIGTNWVTIPNSTTVTNIAIPVYSGNGCVFYRLLNP